jgi:hypothetical protein
MEATAVRCSMCQTNDMIRAPHKGGVIHDGPIYMICPYCDTATGDVVMDEKGRTNGVAREMPPGSKQYLGTGPNSERT